MEAPRFFGAPAAEADVIALGQLQIRYLRDGASEGQAGAFEMVVPPGSNVPPLHSHAHNEEVVYVLEGRLRYSVDGEVRDLGAGASAFTPKGAVHGFSNPFPAPTRALIVQTPDIGAQYFRDIAAVLAAGGPPDRARLLQVMERYGLKAAAPPPPTEPRPPWGSLDGPGVWGTLAPCDLFDTPSTSPWTAAAITAPSSRTKPCIATRPRLSGGPTPSFSAG